MIEVFRWLIVLKQQRYETNHQKDHNCPANKAEYTSDGRHHRRSF